MTNYWQKGAGKNDSPNVLMKCLNCGNPMEDGDLFCPVCGTKKALPEQDEMRYAFNEFQPNEEVPSAEGATKKKNHRPVAVAVIAAVTVLCGCVAFWAVRNQAFSSKPADGFGLDATQAKLTPEKETAAPASTKPATEATKPDSPNAKIEKPTTKPTTEKSTTAAPDDDEDDLYEDTLQASFHIKYLPDDIVRTDEYHNFRPRIVAADSSVNLRSGPGDSHSVIDKVAKRSLVYTVATSKNGKWDLIFYRYRNRYGWISNQYLEKVDLPKFNDNFLETGYLVINGRQFEVTQPNKYPAFQVTAEPGLILRDSIRNGEWILRMEQGDTLTEMCRPVDDPSWGFVEYSDGINLYYGFAYSEYYT